MEEILKEMEEEKHNAWVDNFSDLEKFDSADESVKEKEDIDLQALQAELAEIERKLAESSSEDESEDDNLNIEMDIEVEDVSSDENVHVNTKNKKKEKRKKKLAIETEESESFDDTKDKRSNELDDLLASLGDKGLQTDDDEDWSTKAKKKKGKQPKKNSKSTKSTPSLSTLPSSRFQPPRSRCAPMRRII
ncbi:CFC_HP_G0061940.mRNA.1.CDS.1 [Saccharomyces cerevisiae]|nr:CFC_HP_G0061940.mRNA.1.CDS.1 [Saccharomyces cerevisiae]CAI6587655.1 CFC_HP_G0061940.mRNA.1.CDS.1 [Saccharomyces cerevisiae]